MIFKFKDNSISLFDTQLRSVSDVAVAFGTLKNVKREFQVQEVGCALATQNLTKEQYAQITASLGLSGETAKLSATKIQEAAVTAGVSDAQAAGIVTTLGLDAATKSYAASAIVAKAAALGLNMAVGLFAGMLITGAFMAISKIVEKVKEWNNQDEKLASSIKDLKQETSDIESELSKLNSELELTKENIDNINLTEGITVTNSDDLSTLQEQNELLEAQIALKQRELELKNQETNGTIEKWYKEKWQKNTRNVLILDDSEDIATSTYKERTEEQYFQEQIALADELYAKQRRLDEYKKSLTPKQISSMTEEQILALDLSEQEKQKRLLEKRIADLEAREKQIAKKELENEASKQLRELGISIDATRFVMGKDAETTHDNIKDFALLVESLKEEVKKDLLRGKTPKVPTQTSKGITKEEWNKMNLVQRQQIFNSNRELYNELNK